VGCILANVGLLLAHNVRLAKPVTKGNHAPIISEGCRQVCFQQQESHRCSARRAVLLCSVDKCTKTEYEQRIDLVKLFVSVQQVVIKLQKNTCKWYFNICILITAQFSHALVRYYLVSE